MSKNVLRVAWLTILLLAAQSSQSQDVRIGVFGLFKPQRLTLKAVSNHALIVQTGNKTVLLERSLEGDTAELSASGSDVIIHIGEQFLRSSRLTVSSRSANVTEFSLEIPGRVSRRYQGTLEITASSGILLPVVLMDVETAAASVVQAESAADTPLEALKAQAVATRSYLTAARGRHRDFDFCDTTHCQFLREPPSRASNAFRAIVATQGMVLAYREQTVPAMFTRSCGGRTRTPQEVGLSTSTYPYFPADCDFCRRQPFHWTRHISADQASDLRERGEMSRLDIGRKFGWDAVPSNNYPARNDSKGITLDGTGEGHGIGLCQAGAKAMAEHGATFRQILEHYYPNTTLAMSSKHASR
jgi:peptidoglycan hydrolase-like amidase